MKCYVELVLIKQKSSLQLIFPKDIIKHRLHLQHEHTLHSYFSAACINSLVCPLGLNETMATVFFQQTMATVVSAGLIYTICEMYIDDCNVIGKDTYESVFRLFFRDTASFRFSKTRYI